MRRISRSRPPACRNTGFERKAVTDALAAIQNEEIDYPEFLRRIIKGGCASYMVFLRGRKTVYTGNDGESYTENFPAQLTRYLES